MEPLNGRKPAEFMAALNKQRPADDKIFLAYYFLQRVLWEVHVMHVLGDHRNHTK
jgi:hypothetical protein